MFAPGNADFIDWAPCLSVSDGRNCLYLKGILRCFAVQCCGSGTDNDCTGQGHNGGIFCRPFLITGRIKSHCTCIDSEIPVDVSGKHQVRRNFRIPQRLKHVIDHFLHRIACTERRNVEQDHTECSISIGGRTNCFFQKETLLSEQFRV